MTRLYVGGEDTILLFERKGHDLTRLGSYSVGPMPSFLAFCDESSRLFAVAENGDSLVSLEMRDEALVLVDRAPCDGGPAYVAVDESLRLVFTASYGSGEVRSYSFGGDGKLTLLSSSFAGENAHSIQRVPGTERVLVACKGADTLVEYELAAGALTNRRVTSMEKGSGPRHLAFASADELYLVGENDVSLTRVVRREGIYETHSRVVLLGEVVSGRDSGADVHLSKDRRFAYVTTRGTNRLVTVAIDDNALRVVHSAPTPGRVPRHFSLIGDSEVVVGLQEDSSIAFGDLAADGSVTFGPTFPVSERAFFVATRAR